MKIVKNLTVALVVILAIATVVVYLLPNRYTITNTIEINRPSAVVYQQVANFNKWQDWSPWHEKDPEAQVTIAGSPGIEGHKMSWNGSKVGVGYMVLTAYGENESLVCTDFFEKPMNATAKDYWTFENEGNKTLVTWTSTGGLKFPFGRLAGLGMQSIVGDPQRKGLANLKKICEAIEVPDMQPVVSNTDSASTVQ